MIMIMIIQVIISIVLGTSRLSLLYPVLVHTYSVSTQDQSQFLAISTHEKHFGYFLVLFQY